MKRKRQHDRGSSPCFVLAMVKQKQRQQKQPKQHWCLRRLLQARSNFVWCSLAIFPVSCDCFVMNFPRFQTVPTKRARGSAAVSAKKYTKQLCAFDGRSSRSSSVWSETNPLILPKARNKEKANHQRIQTVAAPMVAASDYAFRCLCRQHGVDLCFTQMIHAKNLVDSKVFRRNHLDLYEFQNDNGDREHRPLLLSQLNCLKGCSPASTSLLRIPQPQQQHQQQQETPDLISYENSRTGPLIVQLAGCNVNTVVKAAHLIVEETNGLVDGIDLNLGAFLTMLDWRQVVLCIWGDRNFKME